MEAPLPPKSIDDPERNKLYLCGSNLLTDNKHLTPWLKKAGYQSCQILIGTAKDIVVADLQQIPGRDSLTFICYY